MQTKSPSGANTRIMRGFYNILNTNDLCLRRISSLCEKAHFVMQNGLFQRAKWPISHPNMGFIALRNGPYQNTKRTFPDYDMGYIKILYCPECPSFCTIYHSFTSLSRKYFVKIMSRKIVSSWVGFSSRTLLTGGRAGTENMYRVCICDLSDWYRFIFFDMPMAVWCVDKGICRIRYIYVVTVGRAGYVAYVWMIGESSTAWQDFYYIYMVYVRLDTANSNKQKFLWLACVLSFHYIFII